MSTTSTASVEQEIAEAKAEALGLAARKLVAALEELRAFDDKTAFGHAAGSVRARLVSHAAYRVQSLIIQREALGLRDPAYVLKFYSVPREIAVRIGVPAPA